MPSPAPESWLTVTDAGLYCEPGGFYVDPHRPVERAVVTHGHADHARAGHAAVLATAPTLAIMRQRLGERSGRRQQALAYGERLSIGEVAVTLRPAGHVLGSAQVVLEWRGSRVVVSGDFKRRPDPTCAPFEPVACDVFITEATFGLPVFRHPPDSEEIGKLLRSLALFPERAHLVGVYALGKAQRVITLLRQAGYERPIYLHGALKNLCQLYEELGVSLGELRPATGADKATLKGEIVLAPPAALADRWARRLPDPVAAMASGWMRVRARARQRGAELPLIISDHADWDELTQTLADVRPGELWVTHGNEEALVHYACSEGFAARALSLVGRGEDEQEAGPAQDEAADEAAEAGEAES
jgi:putative mRNA 3-end processing factor